MDQNENQEVSDTLRELGEGIQRINGSQQQQSMELADLRGTVGGLRGELGGLNGRLTGLTSDLSSVRGDLSGLESKVTEHHNRFEEFRARYERDDVKRDAQVAHARLMADWDRRFAQREDTRALARGLVHTLTAESVRRNMVNTQHIRACVEERFLYEPAYWLAPALLSVAAEYAGENELSYQARGHAQALDKSKSDLFFALTAARLGDRRRAANWMDNYLQSLNPLRLSQDFLVVLEAIAGQELGPEAHTYALRTMERWYAEAPATVGGDREARSKERARRWRARMWELRTRLPVDEFAALRQVYAGDWAELTEAYERATVAEGTLAYLSAQFPAGPEVRADVRHVDSALEHLIKRFEPDEAELHGKLEWEQRIIEARGDKEAAEREHELRQSVDAEVMTFEQLLDNAVFLPSQVELGVAARRLALMCVWRQIQDTSTEFVRASLARRPPTLKITVEGWRTELPTDPAARVDAEPLKAALVQHVEDRTRRRVDAVHYQVPRGACVVAGPVAVLVGALALQSALLVLFVLAGCAGTVWGALEFRRVPAERRRQEAEGRERREHGLRLLSDVLDQRVQLFASWREYIARLNALKGWIPPGGPPRS